MQTRIQGFISSCPWCNSAAETATHLFWDCELSRWAWGFVSKWWSLPNLLQESSQFSLSRLLNFKVSRQAKRIWIIVVAAVLWTVWLARNELVFSKVKVNKQSLTELIYIRTSKWGKASGVLNYGDTPLWKVHPQGAIALHTFKECSSFWLHKRHGFDFICAVDGAWGTSDSGRLGGGIGGTIHNNQGSLILSFSGPVSSSNALHTEIEGILFVI